ncbi:MAG: hypothetical protein E7358_04650 [Clostridiales bacterium]|nr:hypothetical protein [Clostridiales bacterium]
MRNKLVKSLIFLFILMICTVLFVCGTRYVDVSNIKSFKIIKGIAMETSSGYNELKSSIDQKYTEEFVKILNQTSSELKTGIKAILGDEYLLLSDEYNAILDDVNKKKRDFELNEEYLSLKNRLSELKVKIDSLDKSSKEEYIEEFKSVLSKISTLNTKFNNQLKSKRDRLSEIFNSLKELFIANKGELIELRKNQMNSTRESLKELILSYNVEVTELNEAFSINNKTEELPFDVASMQNLMVAGRLETECFAEILSENHNNTVVFSENNHDIKS